MLLLFGVLAKTTSKMATEASADNLGQSGNPRAAWSLLRFAFVTLYQNWSPCPNRAETETGVVVMRGMTFVTGKTKTCRPITTRMRT